MQPDRAQKEQGQQQSLAYSFRTACQWGTSRGHFCWERESEMSEQRGLVRGRQQEQATCMLVVSGLNREEGFGLFFLAAPGGGRGRGWRGRG